MRKLISLNEICLDPLQYPLKLKKRQDGQVTVTCTIPISLHEENTQAQITLIVSPEDLQKLANVHRGLLGASIAWQCSTADFLISPRPFPKRKRIASMDAKGVYQTIKYLQRHPDGQSHWFRKLVQAVQQSFNVCPSAMDITAWLIEQLHGVEWTACGLRRPTDNVPKFAKEYLYTKPRMIQCTPDNLPDLASKLNKVIRKVLAP